MVTLSDVRAAQPEWFSRKNKRFFGDIGYRVLHGGVSGKAFLVRETYAWSDMFGSAKRRHFRVNPINEGLTIGSLVDEIFPEIESVKRWLKSQ